jgi:hypothetical protein
MGSGEDLRREVNIELVDTPFVYSLIRSVYGSWTSVALARQKQGQIRTDLRYCSTTTTYKDYE